MRNKNIFTTFIICFYIILLPLICNAKITNFNQVKKQALNIYAQNRYTFFCQTPFTENGKVFSKDCATCPPKEIKIQWMHIVPAKTLAGNLLCWNEKICIDKKGKTYGGKRCCKNQNEYYQQREADLHNLVPELPAMIKARRNYDFGTIKSKNQTFNSCYFFVDKNNKIIEVAPNLRGFIARTYLYMHKKYKFPLDNKQILLFEKWNKTYPPQNWEIARNSLIKTVQEDGNSYIKI